ncbi:MAG: S8 family serine peptidase, partial [Alphaproteobacteria bacterium]|nr:S8 family serine peptidase [Alphaproteobacteria bacterium]
AGKLVVVAAGNNGAAPGTIGSPGAAVRAVTVGAVAEWTPGSPNAWHSAGIYIAPFSGRGPTADGDTGYPVQHRTAAGVRRGQGQRVGLRPARRLGRRTTGAGRRRCRLCSHRFPILHPRARQCGQFGRNADPD